MERGSFFDIFSVNIKSELDKIKNSNLKGSEICELLIDQKRKILEKKRNFIEFRNKLEKLKHTNDVNKRKKTGKSSKVNQNTRDKNNNLSSKKNRLHSKDNVKEKEKKIKQEKKEIKIEDKELWDNLEACFFTKNFPTRDILEGFLFTEPVSLNESPSYNIGKHWTENFREVYNQKKSLRQLPKPPPADSECSIYWMKYPPTFDVEDSQLHNKSLIHRLLSSLIDAEPMKVSRESRTIYLKTNVLPTKLPRSFENNNNRYLFLDFEQKIDCELKAIELTNRTPNIMSSDRNEEDNSAFSAEIDALYVETKTNLIPKLQSTINEILGNYDSIVAIKQKHDERTSEIKAAISKYNTMIRNKKI